MNSGSQAPPTRSNILGNAGETNHFFAIPVPGRRQRFDFLRQERMLGTNRDDYFHNVDSGIRYSYWQRHSNGLSKRTTTSSYLLGHRV